MEELRLRIRELEHLVNFSSSVEHSVSVTDSVSAIITPRDRERQSTLETLLAASEFDNKNLNIKLNESQTRNAQLIYYNAEQLKAKDSRIMELEQNSELLQLELKTSRIRINNVTKYINLLPSEDELSEAKATISKYEKDNYLLKENGIKMKLQITKLNDELISKEKLYQSVLITLEDLKTLTSDKGCVVKLKDNQLLSNVHSNTSDEENEENVIIMLKSQLLRSSKIIESLRLKLSQCDTERSRGLSKIMQLALNKDSLEKEVHYANYEIEKLNERIKCDEEKQVLLEKTCAKLQSRIEKQDSIQQVQSQQYGNFIRLVSEISLCVTEISNLVDLGLKLGRGEELPVDELIGLDVYESDSEVEIYSQTTNTETPERNSSPRLESLVLFAHVEDICLEKSSSVVDLQWILKSLVKVSEFRKNISSAKVRLMDFYADMIGFKFEGCYLQ